MARVLLITEKEFRDRVYISDSVNSKLVITSIEEAQNISLSSIIGDNLKREIFSQVETGTLSELNKTLLDDFIWDWLLYEVAAVVVSKCANHIGNAGVIKSDENNAEYKESKRMEDYYRNLAGICLKRMSDYLMRNYSKYPKLAGRIAGDIKAHADAGYDTGLFLGHSERSHRRLNERTRWDDLPSE